MKNFTKIGSDWFIDSKIIAKFVKSNSTKDGIISDKLKEYIIEQLASNKTIMKNLIKKSSEEIPDDFFFPIQLEPNSTIIDIIIPLYTIINYYEENKLHLKKWQTKAHSKLKENTSKEYQYKLYFRKKIVQNITYGDLFYILKQPGEEIEKLIKNDNFRGVSGTEFYKLIYEYLYNGYTIKKRLLEIFDISEEEEKRINQNIKKIEYQYKENIYAKKDFIESKNISNQFELNKRIKKAVLKEMPDGLNKLQKAYYIYRRLCQLFIYDEDYYCYNNAKKTVIDHENIEILNDLDINSEVVCTEITMIFSKFLEMLDIPYQIVDYNDNQNIDYKNAHMKVNFKVDDVVMEADAAHGLQYSDMTKEKAYGFVNNFKPKINTPLRIKDEIFKQLYEVDEYIGKNEEQQHFEDAVENYENTYKRNNNITIEERILMLIDIIKNSKLKTMDIIDVIARIKRQMFKSYKNACRMEIIINKEPKQDNKTYEIVLVLVYNENKDIDMLPETNKFIVVNSDRSIENLSFEKIKKKFKDGTYTFAGKSRANIYKKWIGEEDESGYSHEFRV